MELFRISFGPWEKLFEGMLEKNPVELYSNPDSVLLVLVFEKHGAQIEGVVIEMFKALNVEGEIESFIDTLPTEIVLLTKHDKKQTLKFLLIASNPSYSEWEEEKFGNETDELMKKLEANTTTIKDLSKAYGLHLQEISKAGLKVKKAFFSEPLLVPALSTSYAGYSAQPTTTSGKTFVKGEFILGLTKERQQIVEPLELFLKTLVTGGEKNERLHFLHILSESFLLSNISLVVFDPLGYFSGINLPTKNLAELARYKVEAEPIGFPIKVFKPVNQIKVDLNFISPAGFGEILGFGKGPVTDIIAAALLKNSVEGIEDLIEKIKLSPLTEDINAFELKRTVRILTLINRNYPGMFDGKNDTEDITTSGTRTLGRAGIIDLKGIEPKICFLIVHNILSSIIKTFREKERTGKTGLAIIFPELDFLIQRNLSPQMAQEFDQMLKHFSETEIGFAASEVKELDLPEEIENIAEVKANIIEKNDAGIQLKGRQSYRVFLRPALSACTEG